MSQTISLIMRLESQVIGQGRKQVALPSSCGQPQTEAYIDGGPTLALNGSKKYYYLKLHMGGNLNVYGVSTICELALLSGKTSMDLTNATYDLTLWNLAMSMYDSLDIH